MTPWVGEKYLRQYYATPPHLPTSYHHLHPFLCAFWSCTQYFTASRAADSQLLAGSLKILEGEHTERLVFTVQSHQLKIPSRECTVRAFSQKCCEERDSFMIQVLAANPRAELKNSETAEAPVLFSRSMNQQTVTFLMGLSLLYILSSHCLDLNIQSDFRNPEPGPRLHNSTNN